MHHQELYVIQAKSTYGNNEGFHIFSIWILFISMDIPKQKVQQLLANINERALQVVYRDHIHQRNLQILTTKGLRLNLDSTHKL